MLVPVLLVRGHARAAASRGSQPREAAQGLWKAAGRDQGWPPPWAPRSQSARHRACKFSCEFPILTTHLAPDLLVSLSIKPCTWALNIDATLFKIAAV